MPAAYDSYDYLAYWEDRRYEHESEVVAIRAFLDKIPKIEKIIDIGAGFGRLASFYSYRAKSVTLVDPSNRLLAIARDRLQIHKNIKFVQSKVENLNNKFNKNTFDIAMMIRVAHHLENLDLAFESVARILNPGGYFIFEFANKIHAKAIITNLLHGNIAYPLDTKTENKITKRGKYLPFFNYHPSLIKEKLGKAGFKIIEKRSVSNIRSPFVKKHIPISMLTSFERVIQAPLASINFGPSIFILAKKRG